MVGKTRELISFDISTVENKIISTNGLSSLFILGQGFTKYVLHYNVRFIPHLKCGAVVP